MLSAHSAVAWSTAPRTWIAQRRPQRQEPRIDKSLPFANFRPFHELRELVQGTSHGAVLLSTFSARTSCPLISQLFALIKMEEIQVSVLISVYIIFVKHGWELIFLQ